jgi:hypothetical protein
VSKPSAIATTAEKLAAKGNDNAAGVHLENAARRIGGVTALTEASHDLADALRG